MSTESIRQMLNHLKFNWPAGRIIIRAPAEGSAFYKDGSRPFGEPDLALVDLGTDEHRVLDVQIDTGYGSCNIPDMIAEDDAALFVVATYDGASWLVRIEKNLDRYLEPGGPKPPCIGGG